MSVHGSLDPLVSIDMRPSTHVKVKITHKETLREEVIKVYQTVQQFKALLHQWFQIPPQNQKLYYCDKVEGGSLLAAFRHFCSLCVVTFCRISLRWQVQRR